MTGRTAAIAGWGAYVPPGVVTNDDLAATLDTTDEWITIRTGIRERRVAEPADTTAAMAVAAAAAAMKDADLGPADVDLLIVATTTPDQAMPATAAFVGDGLGLSCGAFDLGAVCAGFAYAVVVGASMIAAGGVDTVVVVGSDAMSRITDPADRSTAILFGDGAGAVVLQATTETAAASSSTGRAPGLLAWDLGCDGAAAPLLEIGPGARYIAMQGNEVFRRAVRAVVDSATVALTKAGITAADVDVFVPHQANVRIIEAAADRLAIPMDRTVVNLDRYGNTSAASIPLALAEAADDGRITDGDVVLLSGFGAGMTWASVLLRWGRP